MKHKKKNISFKIRLGKLINQIAGDPTLSSRVCGARTAPGERSSTAYNNKLYDSSVCSKKVMFNI